MEMELVPPGCHWHNAAEVTIRNFKAHLLSVLADVAEDSPLNLWDQTKLLFQHVSAQASDADNFNDFLSSLLSVGKTADDGNISTFTKKRCRSP